MRMDFPGGNIGASKMGRPSYYCVFYSRFDGRIPHRVSKKKTQRGASTMGGPWGASTCLTHQMVMTG